MVKVARRVPLESQNSSCRSLPTISLAALAAELLDSVNVTVTSDTRVDETALRAADMVATNSTCAWDASPDILNSFQRLSESHDVVDEVLYLLSFRLHGTRTTRYT